MWLKSLQNKEFSNAENLFSAGQNSLVYRAVALWNSLSNDLELCKLLNHFKRCLKLSLLSYISHSTWSVEPPYLQLFLYLVFIQFNSFHNCSFYSRRIYRSPLLLYLVVIHWIWWFLSFSLLSCSFNKSEFPKHHCRGRRERDIHLHCNRLTTACDHVEQVWRIPIPIKDHDTWCRAHYSECECRWQWVVRVSTGTNALGANS